MASTPDTDLATFLAADAALGLALGTNLFTGPVRAQGGGVAEESVFVIGTGGYPPVPFQDGSGQEYVTSTLQITVRSDVHDFAGGLALARLVRNRVHRGAVAGYVEVRVREPEPLYVGQDEDGSHRHVLNVEMEHRR